MAKVKLIFFDIGDTLVSNTKFVEGAEDALKQLHAKGIRLGLLSDTGTLTREQVSAQLPKGFLDLSLFEKDLVILSSELSIKLGHPVDKSSIEIFNQALALTGLSAGECLFCTESLLHTLIAQQTGMLTARLQKPPDKKDVDQLIESAGSDVSQLVKKITKSDIDELIKDLTNAGLI